MPATQSAAQIEYSVYVYFDPKKKAKSPWEMKSVSSDMGKALGEAEQYYNTRKFHKVEVKKKYVDEKNARTVDMTLKTFEGNLKKEIGLGTILGIAIGLSVFAFALAFFLSGGSV